MIESVPTNSLWVRTEKYTYGFVVSTGIISNVIYTPTISNWMWLSLLKHGKIIIVYISKASTMDPWA